MSTSVAPCEEEQIKALSMNEKNNLPSYDGHLLGKDSFGRELEILTIFNRLKIDFFEKWLARVKKSFSCLILKILMKS